LGLLRLPLWEERRNEPQAHFDHEAKQRRRRGRRCGWIGIGSIIGRIVGRIGGIGRGGIGRVKRARARGSACWHGGPLRLPPSEHQPASLPSKKKKKSRCQEIFSSVLPGFIATAYRKMAAAQRQRMV
jgi:hypothetical protein